MYGSSHFRFLQVLEYAGPVFFHFAEWILLYAEQIFHRTASKLLCCLFAWWLYSDILGPHMMSMKHKAICYLYLVLTNIATIGKMIPHITIIKSNSISNYFLTLTAHITCSNVTACCSHAFSLQFFLET